MAINKKILLFYNPYSGNEQLKHNLDVVIDKCQMKGYQVVPVRSAKNDVIEEYFETMDPEEYREIIVAGGDGTLNFCINAMLKKGIDLPIAICPTGTANDFAYYFDIPDNDLGEMMDVALGDHISYADIGVCNGQYFINVAAIGSLVDLSQRTNPDLKNTLGLGSYYIKGLTELHKLKAIPIRLITDDQVYEEEMFFMVVMNGKAVGGFKSASPQSDVSDGLLDVIVFRKMPMVEFGIKFFSVMRGKHKENDRIMTFQTDHLRIESDEEVATDVDGEHGAQLPLEISVVPGKIRIFTPDPEIMKEKERQKEEKKKRKKKKKENEE